EHRAILVYRSSLSSRWHGPVAPEGLAGWGFLGRTRSRSGGAVCGLSIRYGGGSAGYVVRWSTANNGLQRFCTRGIASRSHRGPSKHRAILGAVEHTGFCPLCRARERVRLECQWHVTQRFQRHANRRMTRTSALTGLAPFHIDLCLLAAHRQGWDWAVLTAQEF